jgi:hypothetical protein
MLRGFLVPLLACATLAFPRTFYLSPQGSDAAAGSLAAPWRTLGQAQAKMAAGDTVLARGGTYAGATVDWSRSGAAGRPMVVKAYPGEKPAFTGKGLDHFATTTGQYLVFDGLDVSGYTYSAFNAKGGAFLTLRNCVLHDIAAIEYGAVTLQYIHDVVIEDVEFRHTGRSLTQTLYDHAIYNGAGSRDIVIRRCLFRDCYGGPAINHYHSPSPYNVSIYDNVFYLTLGAERSGVFVGDGAHDVGIYNNTFYSDAGGADKCIAVHLVSGEGTNAVVNNIFYTLNRNVPDGAYIATGHHSMDYNLYYPDLDPDDAGPHSFAADPRFVDGPGGDLRLAPGSPAVGRGKMLTLFSTDKDGIARSSAAYDIGAYEHRVNVSLRRRPDAEATGRAAGRNGLRPAFFRDAGRARAYDATGIRILPLPLSIR